MGYLEPAIADLLGIMVTELGESAARVAIEASLALTDRLLGPGEAPDASDAAQLVWWHMWRALARSVPEAFLPSANSLDFKGPFALALAYARRREPGGLVTLDLVPAEQRALDTMRRQVRQVTGLVGLKRRCPVSVITGESRALRHFTRLDAEFLDTGAVCPIAEPKLRRHVLLYAAAVERYRAQPSMNDLELTILHEEMHAAIAASCRWTRARAHVLTTALGRGLQEPAAVLSELYAEHALRGGGAPSRRTLQDLTAVHPDGDRARAVLCLAPPESTAEDGLRLAVAVAQFALTSDSEAALLERLNVLAGRRRSRAWWFRTFADSP